MGVTIKVFPAFEDGDVRLGLRVLSEPDGILRAYIDAVL
jgi:hypothetical protein